MANEPEMEQQDEAAADVEAAAGAAKEEAVAGEAETAEAKEEDLSRLLEDARSKADENWDQLMRARAELENLRRRQQRELESAHKFAIERFVKELLPIKDSLELGLNAAQDETADIEKLKEGTELTLNLFNTALEKFEVAIVDPEGEAFNPELHQAMSMVEREDVEPNTVVTVIQKGYTLNGRLVRPAMVMVSRAPSKPVDEQA